jgi:hypothetical protein
MRRVCNKWESYSTWCQRETESQYKRERTKSENFPERKHATGVEARIRKWKQNTEAQVCKYIQGEKQRTRNCAKQGQTGTARVLRGNSNGTLLKDLVWTWTKIWHLFPIKCFHLYSFIQAIMYCNQHDSYKSVIYICVSLAVEGVYLWLHGKES